MGSTGFLGAGVGVGVDLTGSGAAPTRFPQAGQKATPAGRILSQYGHRFSLGVLVSGVLVSVVLFPQKGQNAGDPSNLFPQ